MSRSAAARRQKPEPRIRRARFAEEDLVSTFGEAMLAEARRLLGAGAVDPTPRRLGGRGHDRSERGAPPRCLEPNPDKPAGCLPGDLPAHALWASSTGS